MIVHTDEPRTPLHLYNMLLTERAYEELDGSPVNELFNCITINVNNIDDPLVDRVNCTLTNWISMMIANEQVMRRFFRYSGLMFAKNDCDVTVPRNYPTVFVPPSILVA